MEVSLYHSLDEKEFQTFLHDQGFAFEKRRFKMFTFSKLFGKFQINSDKKQIIFHGPVIWYISSILPQFIHNIGQTFLMSHQLVLNRTKIVIQQLEFEKEIPIQQDAIRISMLSPITIYSTYTKQSGEKITQYFSPSDQVFSYLIGENARKKYEAFYQKPIEKELEIKPIHIQQKHKVVTRFKNTIINAWNGEYELSGSTELLQFLYCTGLGAKNSGGFGCFSVRTKL